MTLLVTSIAMLKRRCHSLPSPRCGSTVDLQDLMNYLHIHDETVAPRICVLSQVIISRTYQGDCAIRPLCGLVRPNSAQFGSVRSSSIGTGPNEFFRQYAQEWHPPLRISSYSRYPWRSTDSVSAANEW